jgi:hypothetical protein
MTRAKHGENILVCYSHFQIVKMSGNNVSVLNDAPRHKDVRGSSSIAPRIRNLVMVKDGSEWSRFRPGRFLVWQTILVHLIKWVILPQSRSGGDGEDRDL